MYVCFGQYDESQNSLLQKCLQVNAFHTLHRFYSTSNIPNCFQQIQTIRSWLWSTKHSVSVLCMICGILSKLGSSYFLDVLFLTRWEWSWWTVYKEE
jgi:hypothetical protein